MSGEAFERLPIRFKFTRAIVQRHLTLARKLHEGFNRCLGQFSRPTERYFVVPEQLQRQQPGRIGGSVDLVQLSLG